MAKHAKSALPRIESGKADCDCYLDAQDIRSIALCQAKLTWKLHANEAQSVRLFYQEHSDHVFIYQEECSQPQQSATQQLAVSHSQLAGNTESESAQSQVSLRFVFGWMTEAMLANMLKYGNNNLILLDATFGTNHMKMPLYTGLVMDAFGNGLPAFMVLCQGVSEEDITTWLTALLKKLRRELHDWMCSSVMVDDAIAEINAIK
ncbi:hypothetical protein ABBQ38_005157 [Trebouxia sp. C0009 RCD-2024]